MNTGHPIMAHFTEYNFNDNTTREHWHGTYEAAMKHAMQLGIDDNIVTGFIAISEVK